MKALVTAKRVVDYSIKVMPKSDGSGPDIAHARMAMNPFDEIAMDEAARAKERGDISEIVAVSIGGAPCDEILRACYAMGADKAIRIDKEDNCAPLDAARILAALYAQEKPDLVIMGKQAIDDDCNQTGQMLAALLNLPQATFCSELAFENGAVSCAREVDEGIARIRCALPAVVTCDLRLNVPRRPSLPNMMKARSKSIDVLPLDSLGVTFGDAPKTLRVENPPGRTAGVKVKDVDAFVAELQKRGVWK